MLGDKRVPLKRLKHGQEICEKRLNNNYPKRTKKMFSVYQSRHMMKGKASECLSSDITTSLHYYKRNLTPVKESFGFCNDKTPYMSNFQNYKGSLISSTFKHEMIDSLSKSQGPSSSVKCITSDNRSSGKRQPDKIMQTYFVVENRTS